MSEWKTYKLKQITEPIKEKYVPNETDDIPYIGLEHIEQESLRLKAIGNSKEIKSNKFKFLPNDILFGKLRSYFRKVIKPNFEGICSTDIWVFRAKEGFDQSFLFYLLATWEFIDLANSGEGGTRMPRADWNFLKTTDWNIPPLPEQKAIASVLSSLDDKIDLLHRQNQTLEAMAETLFRQWFVEEAEEDWEEKPLSKIGTFLNGLACQKYPPKDEVNKLPVLKIKQLRNGMTVDCDWCASDVKQDYIIKNGDVIFSWSGSLMVKIWDGEMCVLNQHLFKVTSKIFPKWFYYLWTKKYLNEFTNISESHATTMGHIKRGDLDDAMVLVPPENKLEEYSKIMNPLIDKIIINNESLKKLINLRDTLLPKLMSGKVRVKS